MPDEFPNERGPVVDAERDPAGGSSGIAEGPALQPGAADEDVTAAPEAGESPPEAPTTPGFGAPEPGAPDAGAPAADAGAGGGSLGDP